jgi:enoyl-CoA hydratase
VVPQVELMEFCNGVAQKYEKLNKSIKSINANYKDGENGFETENLSEMFWDSRF